MTAPAADSAPAISTCKFCKRPSQCYTCGTSLGIAPQNVDIDADIEDTYSQLPPLPSPVPVQHPNFRHCVPPEEPEYQEFSVFLAGSIEMGRAVQWQKHMTTLLQDLPISIYNPRRGRWDPTATQEAKNAEFRRQVEWELEALSRAKVICFFFDHATMSPVTMCELGLWAHSGKVVVCCNRQFWRGGNIHLVCERYGLPLVHEFEELAPLVKAMLRQKGMMLDREGNLTTDASREDASKLPDESLLKQAGQKPPPRNEAVSTAVGA